MEIILDFSNLDNWADDCIPKALAATENVSKTIVLVQIYFILWISVMNLVEKEMEEHHM